MTPQEQRNIRLKNDYQEMLNIKGNIVDWKEKKGKPPYVEAYELIVRVRTIIGCRPIKYRVEHHILVDLPAGYPREVPRISMLTKPQPFHPNWYSNGNWCFGTWDVSESLGRHVIRMIQTLQFNLDITNPNSPANKEANSWFKSNQGKSLFPCDDTVLPDPTKNKKFNILNTVRKKFEIKECAN